MQRWKWLAMMAAVLAIGCDRPTDYSTLELVAVTGRVTMDGQPLAGATVRFEGPPNRFCEGLTDADGKYRLMYDSNQAGCTPGEKVVRIVRGTVSEGSDEGTPVEGPDGEVIEPPSDAGGIPARYNSQSELQAVVSASNKTFDFDLTSK